MISCLALYGHSGNGKTFSAKVLAGHLNAKLIPFDEIINIISEYVRKKIGGKSFMDFEDSFPKIFENKKDFQGFKNDLDNLISKNEKFFQNFYKDLIENKTPISDYESGFDESALNLARIGDYLDPYAEDILKMVLVHIVKSDFFITEGYYFNSEKNFRNKLQILCKTSFLGCFYKQKNTSYSYDYDGVKFQNIDDLKEKLDGDLNPQKSYQSFSKSDNSKSSQKLERLGLSHDLIGKTVLDLGCNEGFFSFECERRGAKVLGIEREKSWYDVALKRKNQLSSFVNFLNDDWSVLSSLNYRFDVVLFLAAFHYTKNDQLQVLTNICTKMKNGGLLILEVGLLDENEGEFLIKDIKRLAGDTCQYPNKFTIEKLLKDAGFDDISFFGDGVNIVGDEIPRSIIHAIKGNYAKNTNSYSETSYSSLSKKSSEKKEISLYDVENLLLHLYNSSSFYRWFFNSGYKILKKFSRK